MKRSINKKIIKAALSTCFVFLLALMLFIGTAENTIDNAPSDIAYADVLSTAKSSDQKIKLDVVDYVLCHTDNSEYIEGEPVFVDLTSGDGWINNIVKKFRLTLRYTGGSFDASVPKTYNAFPGIPTNSFTGKSNSSGENTELWLDFSDEITLYSDNGVSAIEGNHYINNGSNFQESVSDGSFHDFYCPTCNANKSANKIKYRVCSKCGENLTTASGCSDGVVTCTKSNCENNGKIFMSGNKCPQCGSSTTTTDGVKTCTRSNCAARNKTFIDYYANTKFVCKDCGGELPLDHAGTASQQYDIFKKITLNDINIGDSDHFKLSIASLSISGYDWTGKEVNNKVIYDGTGLCDTVIAGVYYISSIGFKLNVTIDYYTNGTQYDYFDFYSSYSSASSQNGTPIKETYLGLSGKKSATFTESSFSGSLVYSLQENQIPLVCSSSIQIDATRISNRVNNNLVNIEGYTATYDTDIDWNNRIGLHSTSSDAEGFFHYSVYLGQGAEGNRNPFVFQNGSVYPNDSNDNNNKGLGYEMNGKTLAQCLKIEWYSDSGLLSPVVPEDNKLIVNGGTYYINIVPKGDSANGRDFSLHTSYGEYDFSRNLLYFVYTDGNNVSITSMQGTEDQTISVYAQPFVVEKLALNIDIVNNYGARLESETKFYSSDEEDKDAAAMLFMATDFQGENAVGIWDQIGGYSDDYGNLPQFLISLAGSVFPGENPGSYDYLTVRISFTDYLYDKNYRVILGEYTGSSFTPYSMTQAEDQSYFEERYVDANTLMEVYKYHFVHPTGGQFRIIQPAITIETRKDAQGNDLFGTSYTYGEIYDYSEIDSDMLTVTGSGITEAEDGDGKYYTFGEDDWIIRVVNDDNKIKNSDKNVVYIVMSVYITCQESEYIQEDGFISENRTYYKRYSDRLYPVRYNEASGTYDDDGTYYLGYYVKAKKTNGSVVSFPCWGGMTSVLEDVLNGLSSDYMLDQSPENRMSSSLVSFQMDKPYLFTINKMEICYSIVDIQPEKDYDGTTTVFAPTYAVASGYIVGDPIDTSEGSKAYYEYNGATQRYKQTEDTYFHDGKIYYVQSHYRQAVSGTDYLVGANVSQSSAVFYEYHSLSGRYFKTSDTTFDAVKKYYLYLTPEECQLELTIMDPNVHFTPRSGKNSEGQEQECTSVLQYDLWTYIESVAIAVYSDASAGYRSIDLSDPEGGNNYLISNYVGSDIVPNYVKRSYKISRVLYKDGEKYEKQGNIKKLMLQVEVLPDLERPASDSPDYSPAYYSRPYLSMSGVAVRVAGHNTVDATGTKRMIDVYKQYAIDAKSDNELASRPEYADLYYVYYISVENTRIDLGYMFYSELLDYSSNNKVSFIRLEIKDGFLENEGFWWGDRSGFGDWEFPDGYKDFLAGNKLVIDTEDDLVYWYNSGKSDAVSGLNGSVTYPIKYDTACTGSDISNFYILHLNYEYDLLDNYSISYAITNNVETENKTDSWFTFAITKAILTMDDVSLYVDEDRQDLFYYADEHKENIVMYDSVYTYISFLDHPELSYFYDPDTYEGVCSDSLTLTRQEVLLRNKFKLRGWVIYSYEYQSSTYIDLRGQSILSYFDDEGGLSFDFDSIVLKKGNFNKEGKFLSVVSFTYESKTGPVMVTGDDITADMKAFKLAGTYRVEIIIPETPNYRAIRGRFFNITVSPATIEVYTTVASRKYMEVYDPNEEIQFERSMERSVFVESKEELNSYRAYIDNSGVIYLDLTSVPEGQFYRTVYVYHNPYIAASGSFVDGVNYYRYQNGRYERVEVTAGSAIPANYYTKSTNKSDWVYDITSTYVIYMGLQPEGGILNNPIETFGVRDELAYVRNNIEAFLSKDSNNNLLDEARVYGEENDPDLPAVAIEIYGAFKQNYIFAYPQRGESSSFLYVWPQVLRLEIDYRQTTMYTGDERTPNGRVYNEDDHLMTGTTLNFYIAAYYYVDNNGRINIFVNEFTGDSKISSTRAGVFATDLGYESTSDAYYYFLQGDEQIYIFVDGDSFFYYPNNDPAATKVYLSEPISFDDTYADTCINVIDGKEIYLWVNEETAAAGSSQVNSVCDVYIYQSTRGGYILKIAAKPDHNKGCSETNYVASNRTIIFYDITPAYIYLDDEKAYVSREFNGSSYGTRADLRFDNFFTKDDQGSATETNWGLVSIERYYFDNRYSADVIGSMAGIVYDNNDSARWGDAADYRSGALISAGWYVLLMKAEISDGTSGDAQYAIDMRSNICFMSTASLVFDDVPYVSTDSCRYFIVYLSCSRMENYSFSLSLDGFLESPDTTIAGVEKTYEKTYDRVDSVYNYILLVNDRQSSNGEIVSVTAQVSNALAMTDSEYYMFSRRSIALTPYYDYEVGDDIEDYFYVKTSNNTYSITDDARFKAGTVYYKLTNAYNEVQDLSNAAKQYMTNAREDENTVSFYLQYKVNARNSDYYDNNYGIKTYVFAIRIKKAELDVRVVTKEIPAEENNGIMGAHYDSSKFYGERNSDVEYKFAFEFIGWAAEDGNLMANYDKSQYPVLDWERDGISTNSSAGLYYLYAKKGANTVQLDNYVMVYENRTEFRILHRSATLYFESEKVYQGESLFPTVNRIGLDNVNLDNYFSGNEDMLDPTDFTVKCLGMFYTGNLSDSDQGTFWYTTVDEPTRRIYGALPERGLPASSVYSNNFLGQSNRAFRSVGAVCDVGYYLFEVSYGQSINYLGMDTTYYIFEVTKAPLHLQFWDVKSGSVSQGYTEKVYDKSTTDYPLLVVVYDGFVGDDSYANLSPQQVSYYRTSGGATTGIPGLGLINPYYVFVDGDNGKELTGNYLDDYIYPVDIIKDNFGNVVPYSLKLITSDTYGVANNYYITIDYVRDGANKIKYPEMVITPRPVTVTYDSTKEKIAKTYDGTTKVIAKSVTADNYMFSTIPGNEKSGLIAGDEILLEVDYSASKYTRKDVFEQIVDPSTGEIRFVKTDNKVTIYASDVLLGAQKNNYQLIWADENDKKIELLGVINQAKATVQFFSDETMSSLVRSRITVTFNGDHQPVHTKVFGVAIYNDQNLVIGYEPINYTQRYYSEETMYDSATVAPINCAEYIYELTVVNETLADRNYLMETSWIRLVIDLADVTIVFGGDAMQTYGDVGVGLSATANGVGGYSEGQEVAYFTSYSPRAVYNDNGDLLYYVDDKDGFSGLVSDISRANAGTYYARVIYQRTTNFRESFAYEEFTILRRDTVYSYGSLSDEYQYNGKTPSIEFYITYEEERIVPTQLLYNVANEDGIMVPYNYKLVNGEVTDINARTPVNVGKYQVRPYDLALNNFNILNSTWIDFSIVKVDIVIAVDNATILAGESYYPTYSIVNSSTKEDATSLLHGGVTLLYYDAVTGEKLSAQPTKAGTYKVIPEEIILENYNVRGQWGTLVINNNEISASMPGQVGSSENAIVIVGSFGQDTKITVNEAQNVPESDIARIFNSYKENNVELQGYYLSNVFLFSIENYTYSGTNDTGFTIKIKIPGLRNYVHGTAENAAYAAEDDIYVAVFYEDGTMQIVTATILDDDNLSFETTSSHVKAISVLTMEDPYAAKEANLDWLMYVLIGIGVLAIGLALLLVLKRNG